MTFKVRPCLFAIIALILLFGRSVSAQSIVHRMYLFNPGLIVTVSSGPTVTFTDIKKNSVFPSISPENELGTSYQLTLSWDVFQFLRAGGQLAVANMKGVKPNGNLKFQAQTIEGNFSININPLLLFIPYRTDQLWAPYIILGIGLSYYNSDLMSIAENTTVASRGYDSDSGFLGRVIEGVALGGLGVSYKINENWYVRFETANRWMNSDKFDSFESLNRSPYDFYNLTTFGVSYKIFKPSTYPMVRE